MARTFNARRLLHQRTMERRLGGEMAELGRRAGLLVRAAAVGDTVPDTSRAEASLSAAIWATVLKPYFVGPGEDAFADDRPQSPYARLLYDGVAGATRIAVEQEVAMTRRLVNDDQVWAWLTGPRPLTEQRGAYDPFHLFVDPNGYRLSDRVWTNSIETRARIDRLLRYHIRRGTSAVEIAEILEEFLTPGARIAATRTPYGREGSYAARRLARTEITAAAGRGTVNASLANPFVGGVQWALSPAHPRPDICDSYARGGPNGDGIYPKDRVPPYPPHPHCLCTLRPVPLGTTRELVAQLREDIRGNRPEARRMQGALNVGWLVGAILTGAIVGVVAALQET